MKNHFPLPVIWAPAGILLLAGWLLSVIKPSAWNPRENEMLTMVRTDASPWIDIQTDLPTTRPLPNGTLFAVGRAASGNLAAMRLPGLLLALVALVAVYWTLRGTDGSLSGLLAAAAVGTGYFFFQSAAMADADIYGCVFALLTFCFVYRALFQPEPRFFIPACCTAALDVVSTGIAGLLIPLAAIAAWGVVVGFQRLDAGSFPSLKPSIKKHWPVVAVAFVSAALLLLLLYAPVYLGSGSRFFESLLKFQTHNVHGGKSEYYVRAFLLGLLPWSLLLPLVFFSLARTDGGDGSRVRGSRILFAFLWGICGWTVVTFMQKKYYYFSGPAMPVLAVAAGLALAKASNGEAAPWPRFAPCASALLAILFLRDMILYTPSLLFELFLGDERFPRSPGLTPWVALITIITAGSAFALGSPRWRKSAVIAIVLSSAALCLILAWSFRGVPFENINRAAADFLSGPLRAG
jgi:hypothetical protein